MYRGKYKRGLYTIRSMYKRGKMYKRGMYKRSNRGCIREDV